MQSISEKPEHSSVNRDETIVSAVRRMLGMIIRSDLPSSAQVISIAKLLLLLERFPQVPDIGPLSITLVSPKRQYGDIETYFWCEVVWTEATVRISEGGHYYHPSTGGESFSVFDWEAEPGSGGEYQDHTAGLQMVPDLKDFELRVLEMNLSGAGYRIEVNDESNALLQVHGSVTDKPDGNGEGPAAGNAGEEYPLWTAVALDAAEQRYCGLVDPDEVNTSEPVIADEMDDCGICGRPLLDCGIAIDGCLKGTSMWGNFCAACYSRAGRGIGWGVGQVYARQDDGSWRLVAGFPR